MKEILVERFQQLAGIKPLYEQNYTEGVYRIFSCQAHFGKDDTELFQKNQEMIQNEFEGKSFGREKENIMCNVNGKPEYPRAEVAEIYGKETHSHEDKGEAAKERKDDLVNELNLDSYKLLKEVKDEMPGLGNIEELMLLVNEEKIEHLHYFVTQVDTQTNTI